MKPQLLIGSVTPGSGKTVFTLGLLAALQKRGLQVQSFKCGADYVDPQYHEQASGRSAVNLDVWLSSEHHVQAIYNRYAEDADVCVAEGCAGLFDGYRRMAGSSAEISRQLRLPVILVVNSRSSAYSIAPLLYGFKHFHRNVKVIGVVFNQVLSAVQYEYLKEACTDAGLECLGFLPASEELCIPARNQGVTLSARTRVEELVPKAAELVEKYVDVDKLLNLCIRPFPCTYSLPYTEDMPIEKIKTPRLRIAVARDSAFNFIYRENLDSLKRLGNVTFFSPLYDKELPAADFIYISGGYSEMFARQLHRNKRLLQQLHDYVEAGGKTLAECGGLMLLSRSLVTPGGTAYEMANVLPLECAMANTRLRSGYRSMNYNGMSLRGYEYRYFKVLNPDALPLAARQLNVRGKSVDAPFYHYKNLMAGVSHWYWGEWDMMRLWDYI